MRYNEVFEIFSFIVLNINYSKRQIKLVLEYWKSRILCGLILTQAQELKSFTIT